MHKHSIALILLGSLVLASCGTTAQPTQAESSSSSPVSMQSPDAEATAKPWKALALQDQTYDRTERPPTAPLDAMSGQALGPSIRHQGKARRFPNPSSTTVVGDTTGDADIYTQGSIRISIPIRRYVRDKNKAIASGTLSPTTTVVFPVFDVDTHASGCAERDIAYLNGQQLGVISGDNNVWQMQSFQIPTEKLNFPAAPGAVADNTFTLKIDTAGCNAWLAEVDWVALQFEAAAPVVFVHGILSKGEAWSGAKAYVESQGMTADNSITLDYNPLNKEAITDPQDSCSQEMFDTVSRNSDTLVQQFRRIAELYGAEELHIVGHSKGGMDSKAAIDKLDKGHFLVTVGTMNSQTIQAPLKAKSLITLNTPHLGAPAADLGIVKILEEQKLARDGNFRDLIGVNTGGIHFVNNTIIGHLLSEDHVCDLTAQRAADINKLYPVRVPVFATGTDAASRPDALHTLPAGDANMGPLRIGAGTFESLYRYTGSTHSLTYDTVTVSNWLGIKRKVFEAQAVSGDWTPNDILVTTTSAAGGGLPMVLNGYPGQHHTEVNQPGEVLEFVTRKALNGSNGVKWTVEQ